MKLAEVQGVEFHTHTPRIPYADTKAEIRAQPFHRRVASAVAHMASKPPTWMQTVRGFNNMLPFKINLNRSPIYSPAPPGRPAGTGVPVTQPAAQQSVVTAHPLVTPPSHALTPRGLTLLTLARALVANTMPMSLTASDVQAANGALVPTQNQGAMVRVRPLMTMPPQNTALGRIFRSGKTTAELHNAIAEGRFMRTPMFKQILAINAKPASEHTADDIAAALHAENILWNALCNGIHDGSLLQSPIYKEFDGAAKSGGKSGHTELAREYARRVLDKVLDEFGADCMNTIIEKGSALSHPLYRHLVELHAANPGEFRKAGYPLVLNEVMKTGGARLGETVLDDLENKLVSALEEARPIFDLIKLHPSYRSFEAFCEGESDFPVPKPTTGGVKYPWSVALESAQTVAGKYIHHVMQSCEGRSALTGKRERGVTLFEHNIRGSAKRNDLLPGASFHPEKDLELRANPYYKSMMRSYDFDPPAFFLEVWGDLATKIHRKLAEDVVAQSLDQVLPKLPLRNRTYHEMMFITRNQPAWNQEYAKTFFDSMHAVLGKILAGKVGRDGEKKVYQFLLAEQMRAVGHWDELRRFVRDKRAAGDTSFMNDIVKLEDYAAKLAADVYDKPEQTYAGRIQNEGLARDIVDLHERCSDIIAHAKSANDKRKITLQPSEGFVDHKRKVGFKETSAFKVEYNDGDARVGTYKTDLLGETPSRFYREIYEKMSHKRVPHSNRREMYQSVARSPLIQLLKDVEPEQQDDDVAGPSSKGKEREV